MDTVRVLARNFLRHPLRIILRGLWLVAQFTVAALDYSVSVAFCKSESKRAQRGLWLQRNSRRVLRVVRLDWRTSGPVPKQGLLVSNHLSYLDILVIAAVTPAVFVAKSEVEHWPVLGWFARIAGTIFVQREKRSDVSRIASEIKTAQDEGAMVVLFPEGTSSNGETVLPFKTSLLEPATQSPHPLAAACLNYELDDGDVIEEICYWRDMTLLPHLINLLSKQSVRATIKFHRQLEVPSDRKQLAKQLHAEVLRLKSTISNEDCR